MCTWKAWKRPKETLCLHIVNDHTVTHVLCSPSEQCDVPTHSHSFWVHVKWSFCITSYCISTVLHSLLKAVSQNRNCGHEITKIWINPNLSVWLVELNRHVYSLKTNYVAQVHIRCPHVLHYCSILNKISSWKIKEHFNPAWLQKLWLSSHPADLIRNPNQRTWSETKWIQIKEPPGWRSSSKDE